MWIRKYFHWFHCTKSWEWISWLFWIDFNLLESVDIGWAWVEQTSSPPSQVVSSGPSSGYLNRHLLSQWWENRSDLHLLKSLYYKTNFVSYQVKPISAMSIFLACTLYRFVNFTFETVLVRFSDSGWVWLSSTCYSSWYLSSAMEAPIPSLWKSRIMTRRLPCQAACLNRQCSRPLLLQMHHWYCHLKKAGWKVIAKI